MTAKGPALDAAFDALANERRREIVTRLARGSMTTPEIARHFRFTKQAPNVVPFADSMCQPHWGRSVEDPIPRRVGAGFQLSGENGAVPTSTVEDGGEITNAPAGSDARCSSSTRRIPGSTRAGGGAYRA
jgi:hypothetical protein